MAKIEKIPWERWRKTHKDTVKFVAKNSRKSRYLYDYIGRKYEDYLRNKVNEGENILIPYIGTVRKRVPRSEIVKQVIMKHGRKEKSEFLKLTAQYRKELRQKYADEDAMMAEFSHARIMFHNDYYRSGKKFGLEYSEMLIWSRMWFEPIEEEA